MEFLTTGQYLTSNQYLVSPNGQFFAYMQTDGNFVVYKGTPKDNRGFLWDLGYGGRPKPSGTEFFAFMQTDGNFVVYKGTPKDNRGFVADLGYGGRPKPSGTEFYAILQDDGNFCVYEGKGPEDYQGYVNCSNVTATPPLDAQELDETIKRLAPVIYFHPDERYVMSSVEWFLQRATLHDKLGPSIPHPTVSQLPIGPKQGNRYWLDFTPNYAPPPPDHVRSTLKSGEYLTSNQYLVSPNGQFFAYMQTDGNFVVYKGTPKDNRGFLWDLGYGGRPKPSGTEFFAFMQTDGNFCVYKGTHDNNLGEVNCSLNEPQPKGEYFAFMQDDGNFCVYRGTSPDDMQEPAVWCSGKTAPPSTPAEGSLGSAVCYVHATDGADYTDIQYWFFYPFNGPATAHIKGELAGRTIHEGDASTAPLGEHVGDWEHITIRIDTATKSPTLIYLSQHAGGEWLPISSFERQNEQVVIYASKNGHASYSSIGPNYNEHHHYIHLGTGIDFWLRNDCDRGGRSFDCASAYELVSAEFLGADKPEEPRWLDYPYRWGPSRTNYVTRETVRDVLKAALGSIGIAVNYALPDQWVNSLAKYFGKMDEDGPIGPKQKGGTWTSQ